MTNAADANRASWAAPPRYTDPMDQAPRLHSRKPVETTERHELRQAQATLDYQLIGPSLAAAASSLGAGASDVDIVLRAENLRAMAIGRYYQPPPQTKA